MWLIAYQANTSDVSVLTWSRVRASRIFTWSFRVAALRASFISSGIPKKHLWHIVFGIGWYSYHGILKYTNTPVAQLGTLVLPHKRRQTNCCDQWHSSMGPKKNDVCEEWTKHTSYANSRRMRNDEQYTAFSHKARIGVRVFMSNEQSMLTPQSEFLYLLGWNWIVCIVVFNGYRKTLSKLMISSFDLATGSVTLSRETRKRVSVFDILMQFSACKYQNQTQCKTACASVKQEVSEQPSWMKSVTKTIPLSFVHCEAPPGVSTHPYICTTWQGLGGAPNQDFYINP